MKKVGLKDIAERANTSVVTVSNALSGKAGVSDELRDEIYRIADELGYVRTRGKERASSYAVAVIVAERYFSETQSFYWRIYQELSLLATARGCSIFLEIIDRDTEDAGRLPHILTDNKADGLIVMGVFRRAYRRFLSEKAGVPIVWLDSEGDNPLADMVLSDNLAGGYQMTKYLFELGHRKICYVGTLGQTDSIDDRYLGYLKAFIEQGVSLDKSSRIDDRDERGERFTIDEIKFPLKHMPTAFFCNCDVTADLIIRKLKENGFNVPKDVSVVGFDDYLGPVHAYREITTYAIDVAEMSRRTIHTMMHKLDNKKYSTGKFVLAGKFIDRKSAIRLKSGSKS